MAQFVLGFVRQSKYIFPWILRLIFGKKQKYFWIRQKYIETSVSNPPIVNFNENAPKPSPEIDDLENDDQTFLNDWNIGSHKKMLSTKAEQISKCLRCFDRKSVKKGSIAEFYHVTIKKTQKCFWTFINYV